MPQSSLLGWLNKRSQSSEKQTEDASKIEARKDEYPTPPASSQENIPSQSKVTHADDSNGPSTTTINGNKNLDSHLEFRACTKEDIPRLKQLNSLLLPIPYSENFYRETIQDPLINHITLLAIWHQDPSDPKIARQQKENLIGAIRCRILKDSSSAAPHSGVQKDGLPGSGTDGGPMLYISTLVLLSPFRGQGIANYMLDVITKRAVKDHGVTSVGAHVWEANAEGLEWYRKRGFSELRRGETYYPRLKPTAAVVMMKRIGVLDLVGG